MAYKIIEKCIICGACEAMCPNEAISQGPTILVIDSNKCTECKGYYDQQQCVEVCMVEACVPDPNCRETEEQLLAKKARQAAKV